MTTTTTDMMTLDEAIDYVMARADGGALDGTLWAVTTPGYLDGEWSVRFTGETT